MANFHIQRKMLIDEILKYSKIEREELRVFSMTTLKNMLDDLKSKRNMKN